MGTKLPGSLPTALVSIKRWTGGVPVRICSRAIMLDARISSRDRSPQSRVAETRPSTYHFTSDGMDNSPGLWSRFRFPGFRQQIRQRWICLPEHIVDVLIIPDRAIGGFSQVRTEHPEKMED